MGGVGGEGVVGCGYRFYYRVEGEVLSVLVIVWGVSVLFYVFCFLFSLREGSFLFWLFFCWVLDE